jgi:hypothetical protein
MAGLEERRCPRCSAVLPVSAFAVDRNKSGGVKGWCRSCDNARSREYYAANRERRLARVKQYQASKRRPRKCRICKEPSTSNRHQLCDACRQARKDHAWRERERRRPNRATPTERGYGSAHKKLRKEWAKVVASGLATCARCNDPITVGQPWDLGHDDLDRSKYVGPEHRRCNRQTSTHRKQQGVSRSW